MNIASVSKQKIVYAIVFLSLAFWAVFAYFTMNQLIQSQAIYAKIINLSGKQRMLSQKTTLMAKMSFDKKEQYLILHTKELLQTMRDEHKFITSSLTSNSMHDIYFNSIYNLDQEVNKYFVLLDSFLKQMSKEKLEKIETYSYKLLPKLNHAVYEFEKESNKKTQELKNRELFILIGTLFTILLEALIIVIPSIKQNERNSKKLEELNASLEEEIQKELKALKEKDRIINEQSKMITMREVLNNIAHQWRQPLSIITTCASGLKLKKEYKTLNDNDLSRELDVILDNSKYLSNVIDMFRDFFEKDNSNTVYELKKIQSNALKSLEYKIKNIDINFITQIEDIKYSNYENKLMNILIYIYQNAFDALKEIEQTKLIFTKIYKKEESVIIEIIDNAGGIDNKIIKKVFYPYFTTKHQTLGKGMSLYIVKESIEKIFKGKISVENIVYEHKKIEYSGAKFKIILPLKKL